MSSGEIVTVRVIPRCGLPVVYGVVIPRFVATVFIVILFVAFAFGCGGRV